METKTLPLEIKEHKSDDNNFTFDGILAAYGNVDFGNDVIEKKAFDRWLTESKQRKEVSVPAHWVHNQSEPIGILPIKDMKETDRGLFVKGVLPLDDTFVKGRIIPQIRIGSIRKMSIGYDVYDYEYEGSVRRLKSLHLHEGSLVTLGMNDQTSVFNFKSVVPFEDLAMADRDRAWDATAATKRVRTWAGISSNGDLSSPSVQQKFRKAFFWYDQSKPELLGSYKLPFADVVDGSLKAIPRGVFAAAGAMRGARGGVNIPDTDRAGIISTIKKYYSKMDLESPFDKAFRVDDLTVIDERNLEAILKTGIRFSNTMAKNVISAFKSAGLRDVAGTGQRDAENDAIVEAIDVLLKQLKGARENA